MAVLAGGNSKRFGSMKALEKLNGKPLVSHMLEIAKHISSKVLVTVSDDEQMHLIEPHIKNVRIVTDPDDEDRSAMTGALTAFEFAETKYTQLLPVDTPMANVDLLKLLLNLRVGHGAVVPSWPSGYIEPLHSVYLTEHAYAIGLNLAIKNIFKMSELINRIQHVLFVSTEALRQFDPNLLTFKNFNTRHELKTFDSYPDRENEK